MLEYSCVFFPCNQDSLVESFSKSGQAITDEMLIALGINVEEWKKLLGTKLQTKEAPTPTGRPNFITLQEAEKAANMLINKFKANVDEHIAQAVKLACEKKMGRV